MFIEGVSLVDTKDTFLRVGDVVLKINGKTTPCWRMDEIAHGLMGSLESFWRCGVKCSVIKGGKISIGDDVTICQTAEITGIAEE